MKAAGRKKGTRHHQTSPQDTKIIFQTFFQFPRSFFFNIGVVFNKDRQTGSICESKTSGYGCGVALHNQQNNVS